VRPAKTGKAPSNVAEDACKALNLLIYKSLQSARMSLSTEQLNQVAHLARLEMQPEQADHYAKQLSSILDLVSQLSNADTAGVAPMAHPLEMHQRLRPDVVSETDRREIFQSIAPAVEDGLYIVPKVIE
jgi:aspartyl-tRNA(Asn)/glutamyl-tRNA(Gln) amidotransferase subunit C